MKAETVYDVFLALPNEEKQRLIVLVNDYKLKKEVVLKKVKHKSSFTKDDAIEYLLKNIFTSKKN